ncbi:MAG TPA: hypothetical protein VM690_01935 [Gaiellaceae bacterium]|nr:hypothetical protein [Gaiellaceae bacterium]
MYLEEEDEMGKRSLMGVLAFAAACLVASVLGGVSRAAPAGSFTSFPTGTFLTKITPADVSAKGLPAKDAHWETLTFRSNGTFRDVWFHPTRPDQEPLEGHYVVKGETLRLLPTPDVLRWRYASGRLSLSIIHVPDPLARLVYTAHPWQKIK